MIIDANIPIYWSVPGPMAAPATDIMRRPDLCAPDFLLVETANGLLKYARARVINYSQIKESIDLIHDAIAELVSEASLLDRAADLAFAEDYKIYDCLYLALATLKRQPLATADKRLATLAGKYDVSVELIEPSL